MYLIYSLIGFISFCFLGYLFGISPKTYIKRCLISIDQSINTLFLFGYEDETLSSRVYRLSQKGTWLYKLPAFIINCFFFWDYEKKMYEFPKGHFKMLGKKYHCELSFISERKRLQHPPELRQEKPL